MLAITHDDLVNSRNLVRPNWDNVQYDFPWLHEATQMLGKLLLDNQKEPELVVIMVTDEWLKTVKYVGNIDVMYSLFHWRCLLQQRAI